MVITNLIFKFDGSFAELEERRKQIGTEPVTSELRKNAYTFYAPSDLTPLTHPTLRTFREDGENHSVLSMPQKISSKSQKIWYGPSNRATALADWGNTAMTEADIVQFECIKDERNGSLLIEKDGIDLCKEKEFGHAFQDIWNNLAKESNMDIYSYDLFEIKYSYPPYIMRVVNGKFLGNASEQFVRFMTGVEINPETSLIQRMGFKLEEAFPEAEYNARLRQAAGVPIPTLT